MAIAVDIGLPDHLVNLLFSQFFPQVGHYVPELGCWDQAISIPVENFECFN